MAISLEQLSTSKWLEFYNQRDLYSRYIFKFVFIEETSRTDEKIYYNLTVKKNRKSIEIVLVYNIKSRQWLSDLGKNASYQLKSISTDFRDIICEKDILVFDSVDYGYKKIRIERHIAKYKRYICVVDGERHNLKSVLIRMNESDIIGITTNDEQYNVRAKQAN